MIKLKLRFNVDGCGSNPIKHADLKEDHYQFCNKFNIFKTKTTVNNRRHITWQFCVSMLVLDFAYSSILAKKTI